MRNTLKVAKWEIKRNMKNKSFIISLFLTPVLFLFFFMLPSFFDDSDEDAGTQVFVKDELGVFDHVKKMVEQNDLLTWDLHKTDLDQAGIEKQLDSEENAAYISLTQSALENGKVSVLTSEDVDENFMNEVRFLEEPLNQLRIQQLGLSAEEMEVISRGVVFQTVDVNTAVKEHATSDEGGIVLKRIIPGAFAGIILLSIMFTGMMIFQSASQEKKDKIAEIVLSSLTPEELMQGKILGYFVLGITQAVVFIAFALPAVIWKTDIPVMDYLLVPEILLLVGIAILGYLLFASLFVGIGATIEDISTSGNFQGIVLMLPFLPFIFIFIGPILNDPSGLIAQIGSYIPFTSPGVLLLRLSLLEEWPWTEIVIAVAILIISVWLFMKLAGKIFKTGILMYGKNATPKEIWKWIRA
ncbi:ABC transporter permease [Virgibacillus dakarensis]|nr:ABC transporter permease [Virgibacillus dakarensis]